jgi:glycosyltransferase involved in cell wall biosynthesis
VLSRASLLQVVGWKETPVTPSVNGVSSQRSDAEVLPITVPADNDVVIDLTDSEPTVSSRPHLTVVHPPKVTVVVPTLNEAKNLPHVFAKLDEQDIHEIVLVDGFSTDNTIEVARALRPDIRVVHQTRRGKGNALKHGFDAATGDIIVMLDADGSADPAEIPAYVEALVSGADFAKGTRFARGGGSTDITPLRRLGNYGLNGLTNVLYRTKFTDLCYGYNAFWKHCLPHMNVDCDGFEVETLINVRVAKAGLKIAEVGSFEADRIHGTSNLNTFRDGWRVLKTIFKERLRRNTSAAVASAPVEEAAA